LGNGAFTLAQNDKKKLSLPDTYPADRGGYLIGEKNRRSRCGSKPDQLQPWRAVPEGTFFSQIVACEIVDLSFEIGRRLEVLYAKEGQFLSNGSKVA